MRKHPLLFAPLVLLACGREPAEPTAAAPPPQPPQGTYATPLQARVGQWVASRRDSGLAVPSVSFGFSSPEGPSLSALAAKVWGPGEGYSYTAKTVIHYDGPAQAGLSRWAPMVLSDKASRRLGVAPDQLRQRYVSTMEDKHPGFWSRYVLGYEPRTFTITESGTVGYPHVTAVALAPADVSATVATSAAPVLGFTLGGLDKSKTWGFGFEDVEELSFTVHVGAGLGLRLPIAVSLDSPEPMLEGSSYAASSGVHGVNWSADQYAAAGLAPEGGDEWYMYFVAQACIELSGAIDWSDCAGPDFRRSADFVTPFGAGATFPLPTFSYGLADFGIAGVDLDMTPSTGSDKITAAWSASAEAQGGGGVEYTSPDAAVALSPVLAVDGPGTAHYALSGFRYYFNQFAITLGVRLWVDIDLPWPIPDWDDSWSRDLVTFDLSNLIGSLDLSVGVHSGTAPTGLTLDAAILNVAPTAALGIAGGQLVDINGNPTVMGHLGDSFTFTGTSHDPGRDDLTLSWDWGDGAPAPDESMLYPLAAPVGPNDATDVRTHAFGQSCLYNVTFEAVDDDAASGADHGLVLVTATGNPSRLEGYWQHQLGRNGGNLLDVAVVECYLAMVGLVSRVFDEVRDASTLPAAFLVVNVARNSGSALEQLDRELLVAWLNFAAGAVDYAQLVDTNGDGIADTPFSAALGAAEAVRLDPASTVGTLKAYTVMVHKISEQFTKGFGN
jgi:hypothetical protein